jgi:hypothetical protein
MYYYLNYELFSNALNQPLIDFLKTFLSLNFLKDLNKSSKFYPNQKLVQIYK